MCAFTVRLPDHEQERQKAPASHQGVSLARFMDELTTQALVQFDAETRFQLCVQRGSNRLERGLELQREAQGQ